jgi:putative endonuclease
VILLPLFRSLDAWRHRLRRRRLAPHLATGRRGEDLAQRYLQKQGYTIAARNWRRPEGGPEMDLVAWDGETLVAVEVKTRTADDVAAPDRAMDEVKRAALVRGLLQFAHRVRRPPPVLRIDVVSVVLDQPPRLQHRRGVYALCRQVP